MRITFLLPPVNYYGGIRSNAELAWALKRKGHDVLAVFPPRKPPTLRQRLSSLRKGKWLRYERRLPSFFDEIPVKQHELERHRPVVSSDLPDADIVIATWWETAEWLPGLDRKKGAPVYMVRGHEVTLTPFPERCAKTYKLPAHKVCISTWLIDIMRETYGDSDVSLVPNSVDVSKFSSPPRSRGKGNTVSLQVSDSESKGTPFAIEVTDIVQKQLPDLKVLAFGFHRPKTFVMPDYYEFIENPQPDGVRDIYARSDAFLFTSPGEGFGRPPLEAMATRTPLVSTSVGGPSDFVENGKNGFLAKYGDAKGMAENLHHVLTASPEEWERVSLAGWNTAHGYSWDDAAVRMETALERALERRRAGEI
ncbi:MAG TPA: glycosyltransferase family 4 protein [Polyangiaceae bacterium]|nr:glycosyltransferase family 4 protein [Polyangiaceae bacterium]